MQASAPYPREAGGVPENRIRGLDRELFEPSSMAFLPPGLYFRLRNFSSCLSVSVQDGDRHSGFAVRNGCHGCRRQTQVEFALAGFEF